ncbi:hypothetical protein [Sporisorium scitamineum]|uniref:Uncharacterized protein n=1 Tax=Sporisorium scitamineum TaxID=49012 RepID=A0A0F7RVA1_9BASI|nr:hypothetical protein [Sporisorium scitamineum]
MADASSQPLTSTQESTLPSSTPAPVFPLPAATSAPSVTAIPPASPSLQVNQAALPAPVTQPNFVSHNDLALSIGELHQFFQDELSQLATTMSAPPPPPPQVPPSAVPPPLAQPALPACTAELINKVHNDTLSVYNPPKLAHPSWPSMAAQDETSAVRVNGFKIPKALTTASTN